MSNLMLTIILASLIFSLAIALFSIGRILRGRSCIRPGGCGFDPTKKRDEDCGDSRDCSLCKPEREEEKE